MPTYTVQTIQALHVSFTVDADSPDEAWGMVTGGEADLFHSAYGEIVGTFADASIVEED